LKNLRSFPRKRESSAGSPLSRGRARTRQARLARLALLLALPLFAAACAAPAGDFGRPRANYFNDTIFPAYGEGLALWRGEPVSDAPLTDEERVLRDLGYAILMPAGDRQDWDRMLTEHVRTRVLPIEKAPLDPGAYSDVLISTAYRSSTARYSRLMEDCRTDTTRAGPFFSAALRVAAADGAREKAAAQMFHVVPLERQSAMARVYENRVLINWVHRRFFDRLAGYKLALDRLVLATPAPAAVETERVCAVLAKRLEEFPLPAMQVAAAPPIQPVVVDK
jgi:hypothetical protein